MVSITTDGGIVMGFLVSEGAVVSCIFGEVPTPLVIEPLSMVFSGGPSASIVDMIPFANIEPFGMCITPSNPEVAAIIASSLGTVDMFPCIPVPVAPWLPGADTVLLGGIPALTDDCLLECAWGGIITIDEPGQFSVFAGE